MVRQNHGSGDQPWVYPGVLATQCQVQHRASQTGLVQATVVVTQCFVTRGKVHVNGHVCLASLNQAAMACWVVECFSSWSAW